jgi:hypothetical protein
MLKMDRLTAQGQAFAIIAAAMYTDRCTIRRRRSTKVGLDTTFASEVLASNVPCRIRPSSAYEKETAGATQGSTAYTVRMPAWDGQTPLILDSKCLLDIAARGEVEAQTLTVIAPLPSSGTKLDAVAVSQS